MVNSGNAHAAVTWNVAHLTFADDSRAVFQPRAFDLTFTFGGQSMTQVASKNGPGSTVCGIAASQDGFSLSGTSPARSLPPAGLPAGTGTGRASAPRP